MRAIWKGSINFGLVNIPIQLYTAVRKHVIGFKLLHSVCHTPITYKRWCNHCDREVDWGEIVKGLKMKDGSFFIVDQETLRKLKPEKTENILITEFVDANQIFTIYLNEHYYVGPGGKDDRSFVLFTEALAKSKRVAIGQFAMKEKEHVCVLEPYGPILLLSTLNYAYEIQRPDDVDNLVKPQKITSQELTLAYDLIDRLYSKHFDLSKYKDTFAENLLKMLTAAAKGKKIPMKPAAKKIKKEEAPSLVDLLKQSLEQKR